MVMEDLVNQIAGILKSNDYLVSFYDGEGMGPSVDVENVAYIYGQREESKKKKIIMIHLIPREEEKTIMKIFRSSRLGDDEFFSLFRALQTVGRRFGCIVQARILEV
jgi:ribosomal protein S8